MKHLFNTTSCPSQEHIQAYVSGSMDSEERFQLENHLLDCELCATAIEGYTQMGFQKEDIDFLASFNVKLEEKKGETIVRTLQSNRDRFLWRRIAAVILVLLIPLSSYLYWNGTSSDRLVENYFPGLEINQDFRGLEEKANLDTDLNNAIKNYKKKNFEASIPQFEAYLERSPEDVQAILYAGIACLESGYYQKADDMLTTVRVNSERLFEDSTWFLVLAKIKASETKDAVQLLEELLKKNESGFYADNARKLLEELRK